MSEKFNKPILQATIGDFLEVFRELITENKPQEIPIKPEKKNLIYGMKGLATLLGCSVPTANRIKKDGVIKSATYQVGKTVAFDRDLVLELLNSENKRRKSLGRRTKFNF